jgi:hypothetical protein
MTLAYPLQWPPGRPRRPSALRKNGQFKKHHERLNVDYAIQRLRLELERIGVREFVLSTNQELRRDGWPRMDRQADDPAVAIYFTLDGKPHCMPCDTYAKMADNIAAVAAHIEATRAIERHGVATVAEMFAGFEALPPPSHERPWRQVFELHREPRVTLAMVEDRYRKLARERHPDLGGGDAMMAELNRARADARRELGDA